MVRLGSLTILILLLMGGPSDAGVDYIKKHWHPTAPSPLRFTHTPFVQAYVAWIPACFFSGVLIHDLYMPREFTTAEAWTLFGNCVIPILGGIAVKAAFDRHPEWDIPGQVKHLDLGIGGQ